MRRHQRLIAYLSALAIFVGACVAPGPVSGSEHRWWTGLGPVLPHDTFPGNCKLCHVGESWNTLVDDFRFDHEVNTGVPLEGAHARAQCLRCHNDRGPVAVFDAQGCAGCHEDVHSGDLGQNCSKCHQQKTWEPFGQVRLHRHRRFPLTGAHASVACHKCHIGARVGNFVPTDTSCATCHAQDAANALNPPHIALGFVNNCQRCHMPTKWNQARTR